MSRKDSDIIKLLYILADTRKTISPLVECSTGKIFYGERTALHFELELLRRKIIAAQERLLND